MTAADAHHRPIVTGFDFDDLVSGVHLPTCQLERLEDGQHLLHARHGLQRLRLQLLLIANDAEDGPLLTVDAMGAQTQVLDTAEDIIDLLWCGFRLQDNNHGCFQKRPAQRRAG